MGRPVDSARHPFLTLHYASGPSLFFTELPKKKNATRAASSMSWNATKRGARSLPQLRQAWAARGRSLCAVKKKGKRKIEKVGDRSPQVSLAGPQSPLHVCLRQAVARSIGLGSSILSSHGADRPSSKLGTRPSTFPAQICELDAQKGDVPPASEFANREESPRTCMDTNGSITSDLPPCHSLH
jgi:hypothetical protein